jgi:hypothetical protein
MLLGTLTAILANGIAVTALAWTGLAVLNVAYLFASTARLIIRGTQRGDEG